MKKIDKSLIGKKVRVKGIEDMPCNLEGVVFGIDTFFEDVAVLVPFEEAIKVDDCFNVDVELRNFVLGHILNRLDEVNGDVIITENDLPCVVAGYDIEVIEEEK